MSIRGEVTICILLALAVLVLSTKVYRGGHSKSTTQNGATKNSIKSFLTFNVPLLFTNDRIEQSRAELPGALLAEDADVVCLQEIFQYNDVNNIANAVSSSYPYAYSTIHNSDGTIAGSFGSPCTAFMAPALTCLSDSCGSHEDIKDIIECDVIFNCNGWATLSQECITCIGTAGGSNAVSQCLGLIIENKRKINVPGVMILSKAPIIYGETLMFTGKKQANRKGMVTAEIDGIGTVACAHLTAKSSDPYYEPETKEDYTSWAHENLVQTQMIIDYFAASNQVIVMGDMNCGPEIIYSDPEFYIKAEHPESYDNLELDFYSPYVYEVGLKTNIGNNVIIDHVMTRGHTDFYSERVLGQNIGEGNITMTISDHYGVRVDLGPF